MLRVRLKVWIDRETYRRYILANGVPVSKGGEIVVRAAAVSDHDLRVIDMSIEEWNGLPFYYFAEENAVGKENTPTRLFDKM